MPSCLEGKVVEFFKKASNVINKIMGGLFFTMSIANTHNFSYFANLGSNAMKMLR